MRKGIATETIFYIVIGIVVVGVLSVLVVNFTNKASDSSSCKIDKQNFCEWWSGQTIGNDDTTTDTLDKQWNDSYTCKGTRPSAGYCKLLGYNVKET